MTIKELFKITTTKPKATQNRGMGEDGSYVDVLIVVDK